MRITGCDRVDAGITTDEAGIFASELRAIGFDYVCVSSGGISQQARPAVAPGYQVPLAAAVKKASGIAVQAVGMIVSPHQAEAIIPRAHRMRSNAFGDRFSLTSTMVRVRTLAECRP